MAWTSLGSSNGKESALSAGDLGSVPGLGRLIDPLEKEMAAHSGIFAWRIPWTEEPGGLQSTGSQRVKTTEQLTLSLSDVTASVLSVQMI